MSDYNPKSVQEAWDNHFSAFGAQDVDKILLDYDAGSMIRLVTNGELTNHKGVDEIKTLFTNLFDSLNNTDSLKAPVVDVEESPGMVFLMWSCVADGYMNCTDTFSFTDKFKIKWQNVVVQYKKPTETKSHVSYGAPVKEGGTALVIIDPQVDFHEGGSLAVTGANADAERIAKLIESDKGMAQLAQIIVTLDSHQIFDISHQTFWQDAQGTPPNVFTLIELEDVKSGKWKPTRPDFLEHSLQYLESLEKNGKFKLCVWPDHCIIGTRGHCVKPRIHQSLNGWVEATLRPINYTFKGSNINTEMYSCLKAEMVLEDDPRTALNEDLISNLLLADRVLLCGQALSHCVNFTTRDLISIWPKDQLKNLYLLEDASSPVPGFEKDAADFVQFCRDSGVNVIKCADAF